jgi:hypothetical protein
MIPTSAQLALLRTRPHSTKLWLSIYKPDVVFAARVDNGSAAKGMMVTGYTSLVSGSASYVEGGMTCYVGTIPQGRDKGKIRVRAITGSVLWFAENDYINWSNGDYLTITRFVEPWTVYPRIIMDSGNDSVLMYKDYDIGYTNQNDVLGSFINMGCNYAGFREAGTGTVYYTASGTYNLRGDAVSYEWFFEGAVTTGSTLHTPGYIAYNAPGHYLTRLTVTATGTAGQTTDISYRTVSIYDRPENGSKVPILQWRMDGIDGSRDQGGHSAKITVWGNADENNVVDGALVVLFADDYYGNTRQSIGGNAINRDSIVFCGYIKDGSIEYNWRDKSITFDVVSPTEKLKSLPGLSMYVQSSTNPSNEPNVNEDIPSAWAALLNMDCRRAIYYYLRWHSTALMTNDFEFRGTDQNIKYFDPDSSSIYDIINGFMTDTLLGTFACDRQGKFWAEVDIKAIDNATGTMPISFALQKNDWMNSISIDELNTNELYYLEMGGFVYSGTVSTPLLACAPGDNLDVEGESDMHEGLALSSQSQLNALVGNVFAYRNSRYPAVDLDLAGNYRIHDIAPQEIVPLNVETTDTNRGVVWSGKHFHPIAVGLSYDGRKEALLFTMTLHEVTQGFSGDTIVIPPEAPDDGDYDPGYNPIDIPVISPPTGTILPPPINNAHPDTVFVVGTKYIGGGNGMTDPDANNYITTLAKTDNFTSTSPTWTNVLPSNVSGTFVDCCFHPLAPGVLCWWLTDYGMWEIAGLHTASPFASNILTYNQALAMTNLTGSIDTFYFSRVIASPVENNLSTVFVTAAGTLGGSEPRRNFIFKCDRVGAGAWSVLPGSAGMLANTNYVYAQYHGIFVGNYNSQFIMISIGGGNVLRSMNGGANFYLVYDSETFYAAADIFSPRANSNNVFVVDDVVLGVFRSIYGGTSGTFSDVTPYISGAYWGASDNKGGFRRAVITSTNIDANKINALLDTYYGRWQGILTSDDAGDTWSYRKYLGGVDESFLPKCRGLITHPGDINKLYLSGHVSLSFEIGMSSDRGLTWTNKVGDWQSKFGCYPTRFEDIVPKGGYCGGLIFPVFT